MKNSVYLIRHNIIVISVLTSRASYCNLLMKLPFLMLTLLPYRFCFRYLLLQSFCFQQVSHYKTFTSYYFKAFVTSGSNMTEYIFFHSISHYQKRKLQGNTFFLITSVYCVSRSVVSDSL